MDICTASADDALGVATAHVTAWQAGYRGIVDDAFLDRMQIAERSVRWAEILRDPECTMLVAKVRGHVTGFVSFGKSRETDAPATEAEIWTLYVSPGSWRGGVGRQLMARALEALRDRSFTTVTVWVLQANVAALAFYGACGFVPRPGSSRLFELAGQKIAEVELVLSDPGRMDRAGDHDARREGQRMSTSVR